MTRVPVLVAAALAPAAALAQTAAPRDAAPLAPVWIGVGVVIVAALLALLVGGTRWEARSHAGQARAHDREAPPP